jgi:hypothetical protein
VEGGKKGEERVGRKEMRRREKTEESIEREGVRKERR